jgi:hypothetical protein
MAAAALPLAARNPFLMKEEPLDGPRHDAINDILIRPPLILDGIVDAKPGKFRRVTEPKTCCGRSPVPRGSGPIGGSMTNTLIYGFGTVQPRKYRRKIDNANPVGLADRPERAFPYAAPADIREQAKLRALCPQPLVLLLD